jgi:hypothetical protein
MVPVNLSTRPFYNERLVRIVHGVAAGAGLTGFNVIQVMRLTSRDAEVRSQADAAVGRARLRSEAGSSDDQPRSAGRGAGRRARPIG